MPELAAAPHGSRWAVLAGVWLVYGCFGLIAFSIAPLVPDIRADLELSATAMGTMMGAWQLVYIGAAIPAGMLLDRLSSRWSLLLGALLIAASAAGRAMAVDYWQLLLAVGLFGVGGPIISAGAPKVIAEHFRGAERGLAMGIYMTGPTLGAIIALTFTRPLLLPLFAEDWRPVLLVWSGTAVAIGLLWVVLAGRSPLARQLGAAAANATAPSESTGQIVRALLGDSTVRLVLAMAVAVFMFNHGLNNWLPELLTGKAIERTAAGYWAAAPMVIGILASLTIPRLATPERRNGILITLCTTALLSSLLLMLPGLLATGTALLLQGIARSTMMTVLILSLVELPAVGDRRAGTASGLFFSCAEVGGVLGPVVLGSLYDMTGSFDSGLFALAAMCLALLVGAWWLPKHTP